MKIYIVGGAVRDTLLGYPSQDRDFVIVGATKEDISNLENSGFHQVGVSFPVFLSPNGEEYALARIERKTGHGYHGFDVDFGPDVTLEEDLYRRDLTINAMAMDPDTGDIIDPFNGQHDLEKGILRHVSDAYREDPLRVLRTARFAAKYNFTIASETMDLMKQLVSTNELNHLASERIWIEVKKSIIQDYPIVFWITLEECGARKALFPEFKNPTLSAKDVHLSSIREASLISRLMILFGDEYDWKSIEQMLIRLKVSKDEIRLIRKFNLLKNILLFKDMSSLYNQDYLYNILDNILDAFRRPDDFEKVVSTFFYLRDSEYIRMIDVVRRAFRASRKIHFISLPKKISGSLKGPEVGRAIIAARLNAILEVM